MEIVEAGEHGNGRLFWQNDTLAPIGESLRKSLVAVTVVSLVSFVSAGSLFTYLLYPAFFVYPFVYVVCTIPLAVVRLSQSTRGSGNGRQRDTDGSDCFTALMVASNGLWNAILWLTTMFISTPEDIQQAGLRTFAFMRTPEWRKFGNMVWISGPMSKGVKLGGKGGRNSHNNEGPWWWWRMGGETRLRDSASFTQEPSQEEFLHCEDNGIQMNVVTTITVEKAQNREKDVQENGRSRHQEKHEYTDRSIPRSICSDTGTPRIR